MRAHLPQLRLQIMHRLIGLCGTCSMSTHGRLSPSSATNAEGRAAATTSGSKGCHSGGRVGWCTTSSGNGIIALSAIVGVPKTFHPLQKFEVIPAHTTRIVRRVLVLVINRSGGRHVLHLALHKRQLVPPGSNGQKLVVEMTESGLLGSLHVQKALNRDNWQ